MRDDSGLMVPKERVYEGEFDQVDPELIKRYLRGGHKNRHVDPKLKELTVGEVRIVKGATRGRQERDRKRGKTSKPNLAAVLSPQALTALHARMRVSPGKRRFVRTPSQERALMQHNIRLATEERDRAARKK